MENTLTWLYLTVCVIVGGVASFETVSLSDFKDIMQSVVETYDLDSDYFDNFIAYADKYHRYNAYDLDNFDHLAFRYTNYIATDKWILERKAAHSESDVDDDETDTPIYTLSHNQFSDMDSTLRSQHIMKTTFGATSDVDTSDVDSCTYITLHNDYSENDMREWDSGIQDQGECGSCWDFAVVGMMEVNRNLYHGSVGDKLSEQYVLDCTDDDDIGDCFGGYTLQLLQWLSANGGVVAEKYYGEYIDGEQTCTIDNMDKLKAGFTNFYCLASETDDQVARAASLYTVTLGFAVYEDFFFYGSGVYDCDDSQPIAGYHSVAIIAVTDDYYIAKNSWGTDWGDEGYVYFDRNAIQSCSMTQFTFVTYEGESKLGSDDAVEMEAFEMASQPLINDGSDDSVVSLIIDDGTSLIDDITASNHRHLSQSAIRIVLFTCVAVGILIASMLCFYFCTNSDVNANANKNADISATLKAFSFYPSVISADAAQSRADKYATRLEYISEQQRFIQPSVAYGSL